MNTANPLSAHTLPAPLIDALQSIETAREFLAQAWHAWSVRRAERATWRMLDELSDATRRDLGLAERHLDAPAASSQGWQRGPWL